MISLSAPLKEPVILLANGEFPVHHLSKYLLDMFVLITEANAFFKKKDVIKIVKIIIIDFINLILFLFLINLPKFVF